MFIGLDLGTTNVKALLVNRAGRVLARGSAPVALKHVGDTGVEQDLEDIWSAALSALASLARTADLASVQALGVSAQGGAIQFLDHRDQPQGPVISWLDGRNRECRKPFTREMDPRWLASHTGHGQYGLTARQLSRLRSERSEWFPDPVRLGYVGDVIVGRLCGRRAHDATSLSLAMLYNPSLRRADPDLLRILELTEEQLPVLLSPRETAGTLRKEVADTVSLPPGIPVSPAVHDQYAAALGAGVTRPGDVMLGTGTAWVLLAATPRLTPLATDAAFVCNHVAHGRYGHMMSMANGGSSFAWAANLLGLDLRNGARLDALMEAVPPGSHGLRFRPLLAAGGAAELPPGARGALFGLQLSHTVGHVLRAVVEGLACELARYLRLLARARITTTRLVMTGGAAAGRVTPRIVADVTGLPVSCVTESAMSAVGAAMIARGLVEPRTALDEIAAETAPPARHVTPRPNAEPYPKMLNLYLASIPPSRNLKENGHEHTATL